MSIIRDNNLNKEGDYKSDYGRIEGLQKDLNHIQDQIDALIEIANKTEGSGTNKPDNSNTYTK